MKSRACSITLFAAVLLLAACARFAALDRLPPGWRDDELIEVDMDMRIAAGWRPLYIEEAEGHEPLYHYVHAATIALFGPSRLSYRWLGAACGLLAVALTVALGKRLFGWRAALFAGAAMAAGLWPLMYSRLGLRHVGALPPLLLALYALWQGIEVSRNTHYVIRTTHYTLRITYYVWFTLASLGLAAGMYIYFAGRVAPLMAAAFTLYLLLFHRPIFKATWKGWLLAGILTALLFAPLGIYLATRPLEARLEVVGKPLLELQQGNLAPVLKTTLGTLGMFTFRGDPEWLYNLAGRPVFDWLTGAFFYLGAALAVRRWKRAEYGLLLIWLIVGLAPAFASLPAASFGHTITALPAVYVLLGLGLDAAARWLSARGNRGRWLGVLVIVGVLGANAGLAVRDYVRWGQHRYTRFLYHGDMAQVARYLNKHPDLQDIAVSTAAEELRLDARGMALDVRRGARVRLFDPRHALILPAGGKVALISDPAPAPHVQAFLAERASLVDEGPLTVNGPAFRLYDAQQIVPAASPAVSLPVTFGGRLSLIELDVKPQGQGLAVRTIWRVEAGDALPEKLKLFVHLLAPDGSLAAAGDRLDVWPPTLQRGDQFVQWNDLPTPPPGHYQIAVGVYEPGGARWQIDSTGGERVLIEWRVDE